MQLKPLVTVAHGIIHAALAALLGRYLENTGSLCRGVSKPAISVHVRANVNVRIPDIAVTSSLDTPGQILLPDPMLLIEILSPGNARDTWSNVWAYTIIPSVSEILIVHSTEMRAQLLRRGADGNWPPDPEQIGPGQALALTSIGFECPIEAVYARTHLQAPSAP